MVLALSSMWPEHHRGFFFVHIRLCFLPCLATRHLTGFFFFGIAAGRSAVAGGGLG
jgi:hypothetical protein